MTILFLIVSIVIRSEFMLKSIFVMNFFLFRNLPVKDFVKIPSII